MTFDEIIHSFANSDTVPEEAIRAALRDPAAFVGKAVPLLEKIAAARSDDIEDGSLAVLVHVLGEIGDERALPPLMRLLASPADELVDLLGDAITETLAGVLIAVAGGRAERFERAAADARFDEYVRDALLDAWTGLVLQGAVPRDRALAYLAAYPARMKLFGHADGLGWSSWTNAVTALGLTELAELARQHLRSIGSVRSAADAPPVTIEDFEDQMAEALGDPDHWKSDRRYTPFSDTIAELSGWYGYSEQYRTERAAMEASGYGGDGGPRFGDEELGGRSIFDEPYVATNPYRDVGRNDPCPCGSGRKFKKCCLEDA